MDNGRLAMNNRPLSIVASQAIKRNCVIVEELV